MTEIMLGTQGWSYPDWVGPFYPPGTRPGDFLPHYAGRFDTVELDTTFYATPPPSRVKIWAAKTPSNFVFSAKLPRAITHDRRLVDCAAELTEFLGAIGGLGAKLGCLLIQLPPDFRADERPAVESFLKLLPSDVRFAAEFRHRSWLEQDTYSLLADHGVAWAIVDLPYLPPTPTITAPFTYLRWIGAHGQLPRFDAVQIDRDGHDDQWAEVIRGLCGGVDRVYGYFNNGYAGHAPASVRGMQQRLGLPTREPPPPEQPALFDLG